MLKAITGLTKDVETVMDVHFNNTNAPKEVTKKGFFNSLKGKMALSSALMTSLYFGAIMPALGANTALKNAGINKNADTPATLMSSLSGIVYLIMGIGALWAVAWIIIGGMLLAGSGSNPQKRTGGLAAIGVACIGVYVIYKAYTIAGWAVNL